MPDLTCSCASTRRGRRAASSGSAAGGRADRFEREGSSSSGCRRAPTRRSPRPSRADRRRRRRGRARTRSTAGDGGGQRPAGDEPMPTRRTSPPRCATQPAPARRRGGARRRARRGPPTPTCSPARRARASAAAARAFAAELLADGAADPDDARRRALADPSPHPDLVWLEPPGNQHLVEEVRERVIAAAAYRPFEGERRVFVIEAAEAMAEESQNALLKTLEEPPPFAHLILISAEPEALLETVAHAASRSASRRSRRRRRRALAALARGSTGGERRAAARLRGGDARARAFLSSPSRGRELRAPRRGCARAARAGELASGRGRRLSRPPRGGQAAGERGRRAPPRRGRGAGGDRDAAGSATQARGRRPSAPGRPPRRTAALDLAPGAARRLVRDLVAVAEGAPELALNADRATSSRPTPTASTRAPPAGAAELVMDTRRAPAGQRRRGAGARGLFYRVEVLCVSGRGLESGLAALARLDAWRCGSAVDGAAPAPASLRCPALAGRSRSPRWR